jgi:hypothetical protein
MTLYINEVFNITTKSIMLKLTNLRKFQMKQLNNNQEGIAHLTLILVVVVVAVIGFTGWKVWGSNEVTKNNTNNLSTSNKDRVSPSVIKEGNTEEKSSTLTGKVSFIKENKPSGWTEEHQDESKIYSLTNEQLGCYVAVSAEPPNQTAGWSWPPTDRSSREAVLGSGQKVTLYEMGQAKIYSTSEAHIIKDGFDININVNCQDKSNFTTADLALRAINVE